MATPSAASIANALSARQTAQTQSAQNAGGMSPLVAGYQQWVGGSGMATGLPRPVYDFLAGAFGPLSPIVPMPIDVPREDTGRPRPRRWEYPVGWNMPVGQPGQEGYKLAPFEVLRGLADKYSVVRAMLDIRINEMAGLNWDIGATADSQQAHKGDRATGKDQKERASQIVKWFKRIDTNYKGFQAWFTACLEDQHVIDAMSLHVLPTRVSGKGLFGADLAELELLAGETIRPLLNVRGARPRPPAPAFQQYLWGVPRTDLMDIMTDRDLDHMSDRLDEAGVDDYDLDPNDEFRADELLYLPRWQRSWTPYGFSSIEKALLPITIGLNRQNFLLDYFTEGTVPGVYVIAGDQYVTPAQQRQLQDSLNAIAGDTAWKHRVIVLPPGSTTDPQKDLAWQKDVDQNIIEQVAMILHIQPHEVGMVPGGRTSGLGGKGAAEAQQSAITEQRTLPDRKWWKETVFDWIIQRVFKQEDLEWKWLDFDEEEDAGTKATAQATKVHGGLTTIDAERIEDGLDPYNLPLTQSPFLFAGGQVIPLDPKVESPTKPPVPIGPDGKPLAPLGPDGKPLDGGDDKGKPFGKDGKKPQLPSGGPGASAKPAAAGSVAPAKAGDAPAATEKDPKAAAGKDDPKAAGKPGAATSEGEPDPNLSNSDAPDFHERTGEISERDEDKPETGSHGHDSDHKAGDPLPTGTQSTATGAGKPKSDDKSKAEPKDKGDGAPSKADAKDAPPDGAAKDKAPAKDAPVDASAGDILLTDDELDQLMSDEHVEDPDALAALLDDEEGDKKKIETADLVKETDNPAFFWGRPNPAYTASATPKDVAKELHGIRERGGHAGFRENEQNILATFQRNLEHKVALGIIARSKAKYGVAPSKAALRATLARWAQRWMNHLLAEAKSVLHHEANSGRNSSRRSGGKKGKGRATAAAKPIAMPKAKPGAQTSRHPGQAYRRQVDREGGGPGRNYGPKWRWANRLGKSEDVVPTPKIEGLTLADLIKGKIKYKGDLTGIVHRYLLRSYPEDVVDWVDHGEWEYDPHVALKDINMARRPGGRNPKKVEEIGASLDNGASMDPIVLVRRNPPNGYAYDIADGWHRTLGADEADWKDVPAFIGTGFHDSADWGLEMQDESDSKKKVARAELAVLRRFIKKGNLVENFRTTAIAPEIMRALMADLATGTELDAALERARDLVQDNPWGKSFSLSSPLSSGLVPFDLVGQAPTTCPQCNMRLVDGTCPIHGAAAAKYSDDQPRDYHGRWEGMGQNEGGTEPRPTSQVAQAWADQPAAQLYRDALRAGEPSGWGHAAEIWRQAATLLNAANAAEPCPHPLYRGISIKGDDYSHLTHEFMNGARVDLNLSSWTQNEHVATDFAKGEHSVRFTVEPGAHAFDVTGLADHAEHIMAGRFEVTGVDHSVVEGGTRDLISLRQTGLIDPSEMTDKVAAVEGPIHLLAWLEPYFDERMVGAQKAAQPDLLKAIDEELARRGVLPIEKGASLHGWEHVPEGRRTRKAKRPESMAGPGIAGVERDGKRYGVGVGKDDKGVFVMTHRARSESYPHLDAIPTSALEFIDSTG